MRIFNGRTFPDGYVHPVTGCRPYRTTYALGYHYYLSGLWCRSCSIHVLRICQINSNRDRGGSNDRWLHTDPYIFQCSTSDHEPTYISVGILETMWIWNDFLLPYLVLDLNKYKTISIAIQYMKGSYGRVDMGAVMAALILAVIPVIIFYLSCQKHIIKGVAAGAVKG